jgi:hypothetical protein
MRPDSGILWRETMVTLFGRLPLPGSFFTTRRVEFAAVARVSCVANDACYPPAYIAYAGQKYECDNNIL